MSYKLKVILDTSIPFDKKQEVILTSSILEYNPKRKLPLEEYPLFSPHVTYSRDVILNLPYHKRVEWFFNTQKFKKNIMSSWNGVKDNEEEQLKREKNNIDVFIAAILPTAYPVANNYDKSYDFFQSDPEDENVFSNMLSFTKSEFSHLKINQKIYTVVGVILKNDVFNHPVYGPFLQEFANVEQQAASNDDTEGFDEFYKKYLKDNALWDKLNGLILSSTPAPKQQGNTPQPPSIKILIEDQQVDKMISKLKSIFTLTSSLKPGDPLTQDKIKEFEDYFNYLSEHSSTIRNLDKRDATYSDITELSFIVKEFGKIWIKKKALEYIREKKFDFSSEGTREKEIREYIEKINPSFRKFSDTIKSLQKDRMIENKAMGELIKKMDTKKMEDLLSCRNDQSKCSDLDGLIHVGFDRIKTKDSTFSTIEICLMVNAIEGNINDENLKKIKCSYLNKSLGSLFQSFLHPLKTWDITNRKMFFSIQDDLEKLEKKKGKDENSDKKKGKTVNKKAKPKTKTRRSK
jgi:hypothetical protein